MNMLAKGDKVQIVETLKYAGGGSKDRAEAREIPAGCVGVIVSDPCYICDSAGESADSQTLPLDCLDKTMAIPHYKHGDTMMRHYTVRFDLYNGVWAYLRSDEFVKIQA
jgi:hypothetical protein